MQMRITYKIFSFYDALNVMLISVFKFNIHTTHSE